MYSETTNGNQRKEKMYSIHEIDAIEQRKDEALKKKLEIQHNKNLIRDNLSSIRLNLENVMSIIENGSMLENTLIQTDVLQEAVERLFVLVGIADVEVQPQSEE